jgi:hypothetical protein
MSATKEDLKDAVAQAGRVLDAKGLTKRREAGDTSIPGMDAADIHVLPMPSTGKAVTPMKHRLPDWACFVELIELGNAADD